VLLWCPWSRFSCTPFSIATGLADECSQLSVLALPRPAAWLTGALLGFPLVFLIHGRGGPAPPRSASESPIPSERENILYAPSTSLEQISDWLTKIIVGLGLTQLNNIPTELDHLARCVATGIRADDSNPGFALGIIVYFSVCGFLFGYLWGRLYMLGLFREADLEKRLEDVERKISAKDLAEIEPPCHSCGTISPKLSASY
jgi:hypothetical protein